MRMGFRQRFAVIVCAVALVSGSPGTAEAAEVSLPTGTIEVGVLDYESFRNDVDPRSTGAGFGLRGLRRDGILGSAFNFSGGGMHLTVNGQPFIDADGVVDLTDEPRLGPGGKMLKAVGKMAGLKVTATFGLFDGDNGDRVRVLYTFKNKGRRGKMVDSIFGSRHGSDLSTKDETTSSGDATFDPSDAWVINSDTDGNRPFITTVVGDSESKQTIRGPSVNVVHSDVSFRVRPGKKQKLLYLYEFEADLNDAIADAADLGSLDALDEAGLLKGIRGRKFVNWNR